MEKRKFSAEKIKIETTILALPKVGIVEAPPKTKAGIREITIPVQMCEILKTLRGSGKIMYMCRPDDYVFHTARGTAFFPSNIRRDWKKILAGACIEYKSLKTWRHTHATQLLAKGVPLLEVSKRLGQQQTIAHIKSLWPCYTRFRQDIALKLPRFTVLQYNKIKLTGAKRQFLFYLQLLPRCSQYTMIYCSQHKYKKRCTRMGTAFNR